MAEKKLVFVQDSDGYWHVRSLHPMGLVKLKGKKQKHFPHTGMGACPECRKMLQEMGYVLTHTTE